MRKIQIFNLALFALLLVACGSDTIKGDSEYLASKMLTVDVNGTTMYFVSNGDGTASVSYDQRNPMHKNGYNQYVLTDYVGEVIVPSTITVDGKNYAVTGVTECAFMNNTTLTKVVLPSTVVSIGKMAFYNCPLLEEANVPEGVMTLPYACFSGCKALKKIDMPSRMTEIGVNAFKSCTMLEGMRIPEGIETLSDEMFRGCSRMTELYLPSTLRSLGRKSFYGCSQLTAVNVPDGVQELPDSCFFGCSRIVSFSFPEQLSSVGVHCFRGCSSLTELSLPASLRTISRLAFYACSKVVSVEIPEGVTELGDSAFAACSGLIEVKLPETMQTLGEGAFAACRSMFVITLPESVKTIGAKCFYSLDANGNGNWRNLEVQVKSPVPPVALGSFVNQTNRRQVVVPRGYRDAYLNAPYWNEFLQVMETNY